MTAEVRKSLRKVYLSFILFKFIINFKLLIILNKSKTLRKTCLCEEARRSNLLVFAQCLL
jgi:hypothetical protein